jgi:hypothetical protein
LRRNGRIEIDMRIRATSPVRSHTDDYVRLQSSY